MDRAYIDQHHMVDLYVQGKLPGDELAEFEIFMLEHPEILDDIEYAKGMQAALDESKEKVFAEQLDQSSATNTDSFWFGRQYAVAATVLLAVATVFSGTLYQRSSVIQREIDDLRNPLAITQEIWLEPVRGVREIIVRQNPGEAIILRVDVASMGPNDFAVLFEGVDTDFRWSQSQLNADADQSVRIIVPELSPGAYLLTVRGKAADDSIVEVANYRLSLQQSDE